MLTKRRKEVLDFIKQYAKNKGFSPSLDEIRKRFKFASVSTSHFHVSKLKQGGYLEKTANKSRAINVNEKQSLVKIPLLGTIAAGEPIEAIQEKEFISVPKSKIPHGGEFYALRVAGNSMEI